MEWHLSPISGSFVIKRPCLPPPTHLLSPASCLLLPPPTHLLPPASCLLPPASYLLPTSCLLPTSSCLLPPASCLLPPTSCLLPPTSYLLPLCRSLEIKTAVPLTSYLAGAGSILDDGRDAFSQVGCRKQGGPPGPLDPPPTARLSRVSPCPQANYQGAFVLLTRYVTFSSQMVPKHQEYAGAEASEGRATLESEVHRVNTEELPTVLGELKRQILDEERGRRKLSNKWW